MPCRAADSDTRDDRRCRIDTRVTTKTQPTPHAFVACACRWRCSSQLNFSNKEALMDAWLGIILIATICNEAATATQLIAVWWGEGPAHEAPATLPPMSILKPLCGAESAWASASPGCRPRLRLRSRLGRARHARHSLSHRARRRAPRLGHGAWCSNAASRLEPEVNQLITLAASARHDLLVISDSKRACGEALPAGHRDATPRRVCRAGHSPGRRRAVRSGRRHRHASSRRVSRRGVAMANA